LNKHQIEARRRSLEKEHENARLDSEWLARHKADGTLPALFDVRIKPEDVLKEWIADGILEPEGKAPTTDEQMAIILDARKHPGTPH
jgi:hypothetical protein